MAVQRTRWRPDTCDCVMLFEWDDSLPVDQRTHTGAVVEQACAVHASTASNPAQHHTAVAHENRGKNVFVTAVAGSLGIDPASIPFRFTGQRDPDVAPAALIALGASAPGAASAIAAGNVALAAFRSANPLSAALRGPQ